MLSFLSWFGCGPPPPPPCRAEIHAWIDADGDGWGDEDAGRVCALEVGQVENGLDCDDADADRNPDAVEACDGLDDDCDGVIDEDQPVHSWYQDRDDDGFGFPFPSELDCRSPGDGWVNDATDCDDDDPDTSPAGVEVCGGGDEDCDGFYDEADDDVDPASANTYWTDEDGDGFGTAETSLRRCRLPPGHVANADDCDDVDPGIRPNATEVCGHGIDDDCDGRADDDDDSLDLSTARPWYADRDHDGHGDPATVDLACERPPDHVTSHDDCDDRDPAVYEATLWRHDADGDGFGGTALSGPSCQPPDPSWVADGTQDCDDTDGAIHPRAPESCGDGVDADCDGVDCRVCTEVVIGVLPSNAPAASPVMVWDELTRDWATYGPCPVRVIDVTPDDLDTLVQSDATVLWAPDIAGDGFQYTPTEIDVIHRFVEGGHGGLVSSYLLWYDGIDDSDLADLVGIQKSALRNDYIGCQNTVRALEPQHPLLHGLPATFLMNYSPYAQRANRAWDQALLPGAVVVTRSSDGKDVLIGYETATLRGVFVSSSLSYSPPGPESVRTSYNAAYWASGYDFAP